MMSSFDGICCFDTTMCFIVLKEMLRRCNSCLRALSRPISLAKAASKFFLGS